MSYELIQPVPPMVQKALAIFFGNMVNKIDRGDLPDFNELFLRAGPYGLAKSYGLLVNNSGEDFACEYMAYYNKHFPNSY